MVKADPEKPVLKRAIRTLSKGNQQKVGLIAALLARPEVVIDVELLEVDRSRLLEYGAQIASPGSEGLDGTANVNRQNLSLANLRNLSQSDIILTNLPSLYYRLLKTDANTRTLASPQLRTSEGVAAQARVLVVRHRQLGLVQHGLRKGLGRGGGDQARALVGVSLVRGAGDHL